MLEETRLKEDTAVLSPEIVTVYCTLKETETEGKIQAKYQVLWENTGTSTAYTIHLMENTTEVATVVVEGAVMGEISAVILDTSVCKLYLTPKEDPELKSKIVTVLTKELIEVEDIYCERDKLKLRYFTCGAIEKIVLELKNEEKKIYRNIFLESYEKTIDLNIYGLETVTEFSCSISAYTLCGNTQVWQMVQETVEIDRSIPALVQLAFDDEAEEQVGVSLKIDDSSFFSDGTICQIHLYDRESPLGEFLAEMQQGMVQAVIPMEYCLLAGKGNARIGFRCQKGKCVSEENRYYPIIWSVPEILHKGYMDAENWEIEFATDGDNWKKEILLKKADKTECVPCVKDKIFFPFHEVESYCYRYRWGIVVGPSSIAEDIVCPVFQSDVEDAKLICMVSCLGKVVHQDLEFCFSMKKVLTQEVDTNYFSLKNRGIEGVLGIKASVWNQKEVSVRTEIKTDWKNFLKKLDGLLAVNDIYKIRWLVGAYMPKYAEDIPWYAFGIWENGCDLMPGMTLKLNYGMYQKTDETKNAEYFQGFVGNGTAQMTLRLRDGKLIAEPFLLELSDGQYVLDVQQPDANNQAMAFGGAGMIELGQKGATKAYGRILYPEQFMDGKSQGESYSIRNEVLMFSENTTSLELAAEEFRAHSYSQNGYFLHFRGRVHIEPQISVMIQGCSKQIPILTLLGDIMAEYHVLKEKIILRREDAYLFGKLETDAFVENFILQAGDEIWVNG